jgi:hypothetical protein
VKYLGIHLDRRLTWRKHILTKRKRLDLKLRNLYWLIGRKSKLSLSNKLLVYKLILKPIWTNGIQLWGTASTSNIEILERFQSKTLRTITDAPWYVPNTVIQRDLQVTTVKHEERKCSTSYRKRLAAHPNSLATTLLLEQPVARRLKRQYPSDLATNNQLSAQHCTPGQHSILLIETKRKKITGCSSYETISILPHTLLNVTRQIVTIRGFKKKSLL